MMIENPYILLSYINTKLRDNYPSLKSLCEDLDIKEEEIIKNLQKINYQYDEKSNQFKLEVK